MNKNIYTDLEDAYTTIENKARDYCPHCGGERHTDIMKFGQHLGVWHYLPKRCHYCHRMVYIHKTLSALWLTESVVTIALIITLFSAGFNVFSKILLAVAFILGVAVGIFDRLDTPRGNFTTLLNRKEPGERICIKTHRKIHKGGVFRSGQMYEITPADTRYKSGSMIVQADKVTKDTLTVRVVKSDMFYPMIGENVHIQPSLIEGIYGTIYEAVTNTEI